MATKAGGGRLTFSGRQKYIVRTCGGGYLPIARCERGSHYLVVEDGRIVERTFGYELVLPTFDTYADAVAAIEQWQAQHDTAQAHSGESEAE